MTPYHTSLLVNVLVHDTIAYIFIGDSGFFDTIPHISIGELVLVHDTIPYISEG